MNQITLRRLSIKATRLFLFSAAHMFLSNLHKLKCLEYLTQIKQTKKTLSIMMYVQILSYMRSTLFHSVEYFHVRRPICRSFKLVYKISCK